MPDASSVMGMVFSGSTALAGLVLVFLGATLNAFDGYRTEEQDAVRKKFRLRAWIAFGGFVSALASSGAALAHELSPCVALFNLSIAFLAVSGLLLLVVGTLALWDIGG